MRPLPRLISAAAAADPRNLPARPKPVCRATALPAGCGGGSLVKEAVEHGAVGFSTSRLLIHRDKFGVMTPGALAAEKEVLAIAKAMAEAGGGVFEMSAGQWRDIHSSCRRPWRPPRVHVVGRLVL